MVDVTLAPRESRQFDADTLIGVSKFVTRRDTQPHVDSPEALFRSLRPSDSGVRHLWAHQADLLRDYAELPSKAREYVERLAELVGVGFSLVSTGAVRDETILVNDSVLTRWFPALRSALPAH